MVMVFTLVSAMQDRLGELVDEVRSEREREKERKEDEDRMKAEVGLPAPYLQGLLTSVNKA